MPKDRFLITPLQSGWENDKPPFLIMDDAFTVLENAYVYRGRVRKRFGARLMVGETAPTAGYEQLQSRLRMNIGTITGGTLAGTVPGATFGIGQMFSIGDNLFTVFDPTAGANPMYRTDGIVATADYNVGTGVFDIQGSTLPNGTIVYFYPATPVMGFTEQEQSAVNDEKSLAWDTQFSYKYESTGWERISGETVAGDSVWTGGNSDFFWATNHRSATSSISDNRLFATNFLSADGIRYTDGTTWTSNKAGAARWEVNSGAGIYIFSSRIIVSFKNRLVLLNTQEGATTGATTNYQTRCRFSKNGNVLATDAWYQSPSAKFGGYIDNTSTQEAIITAQFLRDRLIVYFERSTWELVYTGSEIQPFRWQRINTELGAESTFSQIPFDTQVLGVGNVGIMECTGTNVNRIDQNIPNEVFEIHNNDDGPKRVAGVRDYISEIAYWSFPGVNRTATKPFPNKVLTYNYLTRSWGRNDDSITAFGHWQAVAGLTWGSASSTWGSTSTQWGSGSFSAKTRHVIAGNQEGFTFQVDNDNSRNSPALQITDIAFNTPAAGFTSFTVINHNLQDNDYILLENIQGTTGLNDKIYDVAITDDNTFYIGEPDAATAYTGGGTVTRVSSVEIKTKQYNFYLKQNMTADITSVDFLVKRTESGKHTIDYLVSSSLDGLVDPGEATGALIGTSVLETSPYPQLPLEATQNRVWHTVYTWADGECVQLRIYHTFEQMTDPAISLSPFTLYGLIFNANPSGPIGL